MTVTLPVTALVHFYIYSLLFFCNFLTDTEFLWQPTDGADTTIHYLFHLMFYY